MSREFAQPGDPRAGHVPRRRATSTERQRLGASAARVQHHQHRGRRQFGGSPRESTQRDPCRFAATAHAPTRFVGELDGPRSSGELHRCHKSPARIRFTGTSSGRRLRAAAGPFRHGPFDPADPLPQDPSQRRSSLTHDGVTKAANRFVDPAAPTSTSLATHSPRTPARPSGPTRETRSVPLPQPCQQSIQCRGRNRPQHTGPKRVGYGHGRRGPYRCHVRPSPPTTVPGRFVTPCPLTEADDTGERDRALRTARLTN